MVRAAESQRHVTGPGSRPDMRKSRPHRRNRRLTPESRTGGKIDAITGWKVISYDSVDTAVLQLTQTNPGNILLPEFADHRFPPGPLPLSAFAAYDGIEWWACNSAVLAADGFTVTTVFDADLNPHVELAIQAAIPGLVNIHGSVPGGGVWNLI